MVSLTPCTPGGPVSHFPFPPAPFWMVLEIISGYYQPLVQKACLYLAPRKTAIVTLVPAAHIPPSWLQTVGCHSSECTSPALASPHGSPSAAAALLLCPFPGIPLPAVLFSSCRSWFDWLLCAQSLPSSQATHSVPSPRCSHTCSFGCAF